ncbi:tapasin-related protein-like [Leucoraja erinacea]|uniref:tapasin-related protein-like n=1 Tax=Leucoraja erinaceus TaxID=7782 RepID=UPI002457774C|nr:tapasin-related protein-like [Leucoraja erinacea]
MFLVLILSLSVIIFTAAEKTAIHVTQIPERKVILKGANVTFHCIIPLADNSSGIEVRWRKQGENEYIQSDADGRKRFTVKNRSGGYFDLLNTTYEDSGNYRCVVMRQGEISGEGTGSELTVCALPTPLKINWISESNSSAAATLVCKTAEFHPGDLTLLWYKNSVAVTAKANTIKQKNSEGLYTASSSLSMTQSEASGNIYICLVIHISLQRPAIATHALRKPGQGMT